MFDKNLTGKSYILMARRPKAYAFGTRLHRSAGKTVHRTLFLIRRPSRVRLPIIHKITKHPIPTDEVFYYLVEVRGVDRMYALPLIYWFIVGRDVPDAP